MSAGDKPKDAPPPYVARSTMMPWLEMPKMIKMMGLPAFAKEPPPGIGGRVKPLSTTANSGQQAQLGCSLCELEPGHALWPQHAHMAVDEAIYVLEGQGMLRRGKDSVPVVPGDYVALPAGRAECAHQLVNTGSTTLRYLCMDRKESTDVTVYPESGKVGAICKNGAQFFHEADSRQYFDGEPGEPKSKL
eukprot:NODE_20577_length_791_cov_6.153614.p1 GENE.NODE_20577_length_791_cov_6.153614~~NODE_20577_length_791_cov_6.153614.p1  ORF type:complete len:190 (+),score=61.33 NODE_20577_length_791_cov_6.153614:57-626(+)